MGGGGSGGGGLLNQVNLSAFSPLAKKLYLFNIPTKSLKQQVFLLFSCNV